MYRGGYWSYGGAAGLFSSNGYYGRTSTYDNLGFRSAYIPEIIG